MKNKKFTLKINRWFLVPLSGLLTLFMFSCGEDPSPSLFDSLIGPGGPTPQITSVAPTDEALAGVSQITINGTNFSSIPEENHVYFSSSKAKVLQASPSVLVVTAPNLVSDNVQIKVAVHNSEFFSNIVTYKLKAAVTEFFPFQEFELPYGLTIDKENNLYVSMVINNVGVGVKKFTPSGQMNDFAPKGGETFFNSLKYGPDNFIYGARRVRAIFRIQQGVAAATFVTSSQGIGNVNDLDFDENKIIWAGGSSNGFIYSVTLDKVVKSFPFDEDVNAVRVFDGHLYVVSISGANQSVWKFKINSAEDLGAAEKYFDITAVTGDIPAITALTFAADGDMYIGTSKGDAVLVVHPNGTHETLYPGLLKPVAYTFGWGIDNFLYYTRQRTDTTTQTILKLNMQKLGAPYYGRE
jgi:hypothetical protein